MAKRNKARHDEMLVAGWQKVMFTSECDPEGSGWCQVRDVDPCDCDCIGPTEDGVEYLEVDGVLYGRREQTGIGDVNSQARGSGARYNGGKPDFSLIPLVTLADEARVWEYGKKKYAAWNWTKGMPWSVPFACAMRHLAAWQAGEDVDAESGLPHLAHVACNIRMLTLYAANYPEGDDRPRTLGVRP